jgi:hypothetical protein
VVYDVFQSEPRYSIPFRAYEICACVTAVALAVQWLKARFA